MPWSQLARRERVRRQKAQEVERSMRREASYDTQLCRHERRVQAAGAHADSWFCDGWCVCSLQAALTITRSFRLAVRMKKKAEERDRLSVFAVKIQSAYRRHQVSIKGDVTSRTVATPQRFNSQATLRYT